ncbi:unnamed protein product [Brassica rapa subsp. trilocularis]
MSSIKLAIFCIILLSFVSLHDCMSKGFAINFMPCKKGVAGDWCCTKTISKGTLFFSSIIYTKIE